MKVAVVGAGAIGGYLGAKLALAGEAVTFIARGRNLDAIRAGGMKLVLEDGSEHVAADVRAFERAADAGPQDVILLTVKAHQVAAVAPQLQAMCHADTAIVTMQNGIPWWYPPVWRRARGPSGTPADPDGTIARHIDSRRIIGSVVYPCSRARAAGLVHVVEGNRFTSASSTAAMTPRIQAIAARS
jgi:2-dehydropantoate 2-reductase